MEQRCPTSAADAMSWPSCSVFEDSGVALALVDTVAQRIVHVNARFTTLTGLVDATAQQEPLAKWWPPLRSTPGCIAPAADGLASPTECRHVRPDGRAVWLRLCGTDAPAAATGPRWTLLAVHDVDRYKEAEQSSQRAEQMFRALWETTTDAVIVLDHEGVIRWANRSLKDVLGHEPERAVGRPVTMLQPEALRQRHLDGFASYLQHRQRTLDWRHFESTGLHRDGHEVPLEISFSAIDTPAGPLLAGFLRDISERRAAERQRQQIEERLVQAQRLEALGTLAGGIAHDFNNLLAGILGHATLALDELPAGHPARASVEQAQRAGLRARALVRQILAFGQRQPPRPTPVALQPLFSDVAALLRATVPPSVSFEQTLPDEPVIVTGDATQIEQVLMNLATNAWQALGGCPGRVSMGLERVDDDSPTNGGPAGRAHLWVHDTGPGIDDAVRSRMFEPFFTTKPPGEGTGLGLSVVHGIVAAHGGTLTVDSGPGRGSTFHVYLPIAAGRAGHAEAAASDAPADAPGRGEHVLYVDDDDVMVVMVERLLRRAGYRVSCVGRLQAALALASAGEPAVDLVVTDLNMPEGTGLDLCRGLHAVRPALPVILSSGFLPDEVRAEGERAGIAAFLRKEEAFERLPAMVAAELARAVAPA